MATPFPLFEGKYEIITKLKEGGMGAVYKVRHRLLDEVRVIKLIRPQLESDEAIRARLARRPPSRSHLLANRVLDEIGSRFSHRANAPLAEHFGVSERTIERALAAHTAERHKRLIGMNVEALQKGAACA